MNEPVDPEAIKELIFRYRSIASNLRGIHGDPRNVGLDEYEYGRQANIYEVISNDLEKLLL